MRVFNRELHHILVVMIILEQEVLPIYQLIKLTSMLLLIGVEFPELKKMPITTDLIPSFIFYQVIRQVKILPKDFCPYIKYTNIQLMFSNWMGINDVKLEQLRDFLQKSMITGLNLRINPITQVGVTKLADKLLSNTLVRTLVL